MVFKNASLTLPHQQRFDRVHTVAGDEPLKKNHHWGSPSSLSDPSPQSDLAYSRLNFTTVLLLFDVGGEEDITVSTTLLIPVQHFPSRTFNDHSTFKTHL